MEEETIKALYRKMDKEVKDWQKEVGDDAYYGVDDKFSSGVVKGLEIAFELIIRTTGVPYIEEDAHHQSHVYIE